MRVLRERRVGREGEIVPEERRPVLERAGADDRRRRRVRHGLVAARELEDDRLRRHARERRATEVRRRTRPGCPPATPTPCSRSAAGSRDAPGTVSTSGGRFRSGMFSLNWTRPGRFDQRRRPADEAEPRRAARNAGLSRAISMIAPPGTFGHAQRARSARRRGTSCRRCRRTTGRSRRSAPGRDRACRRRRRPRRPRSRARAHQVDHGLAQAVAAADERLRGDRVDALGGVDGAVAVLVEPAAAGRERHRRAGRCG